MFHSLRSRLLVSYFVVVLLTLCIAGTGLLFLLQDYQRGIVNQRLTDALGPAAIQARSALRQGASVEQVAQELQAELDPSWRVMLLDETGLIVADSQSEFAQRRLPRITLLQKVGKFRFATGRQLIEGRELAYAAAPVGRPVDNKMYLMVATIIRPVIGGLEDLARPLLIAGATAFGAAIVLAVLMARSIAQPLGRLTEATEAIARGNYDQQIDVQGQDEVGRLAASFNAMARAVKRSQQVQKDCVANVSHELKTPLTSIQGFSQAIVEGATRDMESAKHAAKLIHEEAQRMARLVADLLTLARLDASDVPQEQETLDLSLMLPAWVDRFQTRAREENLSLMLILDSPPLVVGDAGRLEQVVANLIDNAFKYNRPGGSVQVYAGGELHALAASNGKASSNVQHAVRCALLRVRDTGVGISASKQAHLFERFFRADAARVAGGTGLGLSIVKEIVRQHRGEITVESVEGIGTTFNVWLPAK